MEAISCTCKCCSSFYFQSLLFRLEQLINVSGLQQVGLPRLLQYALGFPAAICLVCQLPGYGACNGSEDGLLQKDGRVECEGGEKGEQGC